jgi:hypothetical protein
MSIAKLSGCIMLAAIVGCTTQPAKTVNTAGSDLQCHTDTLTGSRINKTVCTTQAERDAEQASVSSVHQSVQSAVAGSPGPR